MEWLEPRTMLAGDLGDGAEGESPAPLVAIRVEAANLGGQAITSVGAGQEFFLRAGVRDLRTGVPKPGVFAAYFDLEFDASRADVIRSETNPLGFDIAFGPQFGNAADGNVNTPGVVDEVGAFQTGLTPLGAAEVLLFNIRFRAGGVTAANDTFSAIKEDSTVTLGVLANDSVSAGPVGVTAGPADQSPAHDVLVFDPPSVVPTDRIQFSASPLTIVGGPLTVTAVTQGSSGGVVQISPGGASVVYKPAADFFGTETFEYTVNGSATARVTVHVDPVNDAPRAAADRYAAERNETLSVDVSRGVLANDVDPENDQMTARTVAAPVHGTLQLAADGSFTYRPEADFRGVDQFTYVASDGQADSAPATVTILVDPPSASMRLETVNAAGQKITSVQAGQPFHLRAYVEDLRDVPMTGIYAAYLDVHYEARDVAVVASATNPLGFDVAFLSGYTNGKSGDASVPGLIDNLGAFQVSTQPTGPAAAAFADVAFQAASAVTKDDAFTGVLEDSTDVSLDVLKNDRLAAGTTRLSGRFAASSPTHDVLPYLPPDPIPEEDLIFFDAEILVTPAPNFRITQVGSPNRGGSVRIAADGSRLFYSPAPDFHGVETLTYTAGGSTSTVTVTVEAVNDAPVAVADRYRVRENLPLVVGAPTGVLSNDADADGDAMFAELVTAPVHGTVQLSADGGFTYTPPLQFEGPDRFEYRVTDGAAFSLPAVVELEFDPPPVSIRLVVTDLAGAPISEGVAGQRFLVSAVVQDLRPDTVPARGVFAAYLDVVYDEAVQVVADAAHALGFAIQFGPEFSTPGTGDINSPGVINEAGSFQAGLTPLGPGEFVLFSVAFESHGPRAADDAFAVSQKSEANELDLLRNDLALRWETVFGADPADETPASDVLLFEPPVPVADVDIRYRGDSMTLRNPALRIVSAAAGSSGGTVVVATGGGSVVYTPLPGFAGTETFQYTVQAPDGRQATATVSVDVVPSWHNLRNPLDVNSDMYVQPVDALIVINDLNARGPRPLGSPAAPPFLDVNNDKIVSPVDVLMVINYLNRNQSGGSGEARVPSAVTLPLTLPPPVTAAARSGLAEFPRRSLPAETVAAWHVPVAGRVADLPALSRTSERPGAVAGHVRPAVESAAAEAARAASTLDPRLLAAGGTVAEALEAAIDGIAEDVFKGWVAD